MKLAKPLLLLALAASVTGCPDDDDDVTADDDDSTVETDDDDVTADDDDATTDDDDTTTDVEVDLGDPVTCADPISGWSRFSEEGAARGVDRALTGIWIEDEEIFDESAGIVARDIDGDGDADIVVGQDSDIPFTYLNDGDGQFIEGPALVHPFEQGGWIRTSLLAVVDVDADGLPEIAAIDEFVYLWHNLGDGEFDTPELIDPGNGLFHNALVFGDPDRDGDLDLLAVTATAGPLDPIGPPDQLLLNDGSGNFEAWGPVYSKTKNGIEVAALTIAA